MRKNSLWSLGGTIWRVLEENVRERQVLVVDCLKKTMPVWKNVEEWCDTKEIPEQELLEAEGITAESLESYDPALAHRRFSMIAPILPVIGRKKERSVRIWEAAELFGADPQTIRQYLCRYLVFRDIRVLAPVKKPEPRELTPDEKNMRWALNKYYYSNLKWPLTTVYVHLLKEKYTDSMGQLMEPHPSIRQFRYFCSKHEKLQTRYISRDGLKDYQRNNRPLLGDGVQEFAPAAGWAMLDSTVCDIYLVNEEGQLVGRPVLVAGIDAYSGIGTIGMIAADYAGEVTGVELNRDAVKDAIANARGNKIKNIRFVCDDAGDFMVKAAAASQKYDVVFMDPPRAGASRKFLDCLLRLTPEKVVYISCNPETLKRDMAYLTGHGYRARKIQPVDMFPGTSHVETVVLLTRNT